MDEERVGQQPDEDLPLIPHDCWEGSDPRVFDERGVFGPVGGPTPGWPPFPPPKPPVLPRPPWLPPASPWPWEPVLPFPRACSLQALNGSWFLQFKGLPALLQLRGPLRIEAGADRLRVSGDMYRRLFDIVFPFERATLATMALPRDELDHPAAISLPPGSLVLNLNWYPQFPQTQYAWYLRSTGVSYSGGVLDIPFERHLWSHSQQAFTTTDTGWLRLSCNVDILRAPLFPQPTLRMTGQAMVGGNTFQVEAVKTSPYYRGCEVEVDVMANRNWPASAAHGGGTVTFTGVYRAQGMDIRAVVNETDVPEQASLTVTNLNDLLTTHRAAATGAAAWRLWLLVGSRLGTTNTYGLMFDQVAPHREGSVGFADATLPDQTYVEAAARGQTLNAVAAAFLRTLIHEAGHAFNLYHPKSDTHAPPVGRTIMNQTGDVMGFASSSDPYPGNAQFSFNDHNATSLVHSPDPQVAPGWRDFGWGHSSLWTGAAEPTDVAGLDEPSEGEPGLRVELRIPERVVRGEIPVADVVVTNESDAPRSVTAALNLAEGDLRVDVEQPSGDMAELRDVVLVCGPRRLVELQPGESVSGTVQLFYTNQGFAFDQPGLYTVSAVLDVGDGSGRSIRSAPQQVELDLPVDDEERALADLTLDPEVGLSVAFGDVGPREEAQERLTEAMDRFATTDTGGVAAMVLANSLSRPDVDLANGETVRQPDRRKARDALDKAVEDRSAIDVVRLAVAAASPAEPQAPVLDAALERVREAPEGTYDQAEVAEAEQMLDSLRE
ncbi:MAG: hypothetical protein ACRDI0_05275 [Actinomycetota bacterium]